MGGLGDREGPAVTTTTVDWLSARLDEDEERARGGAERFAADTDWGFIFRREVREVEAKRAIVADLTLVLDTYRGGILCDLANTTLRHLAAVYADHPDYNEAWRP